MPSHDELTAIRQQLNALSGEARRRLLGFLGSGAGRIPISDELLVFWGELVAEFGEAAAALGADMFELQAEQVGLSEPSVVLAEPPGGERVKSSALWALKQDDQRGALAGALDRLVKQAYRDTFGDSAEASRVRWARVPKGKTCAFCRMLASRGAVYTSRDTADGGRYHAHCDCTPVLVRDGRGWPSGYSPDRYRAEYDAAVRRAGGDERAVLADMRANEAEEFRTPAQKAYWMRRQQDTGIKTNGEALEPREVKFAERMVARGEEIEWIAKPKPTPSAPEIPPSPDFRWRGGTWELKSGQNPKTLRKVISSKARRAEAAGAPIRRFVVDIGDARTSRKIESGLRLYNRDRDAGLIEELWLMSDGGATFKRVPLA